jgi:WD40-like Beta Propeller Repeat
MRRRLWWLPLAVLLVALGASGGTAGCGTSGNHAGTSDGGAGSSSGLDGSGSGSDSSLLGHGGDAATQALQIAPANPTLDVSAAGATLQFNAYLAGSTTPVAATWTIDVAQIGAIASTGLFTASGVLGGQTTVTATVGSATASTVLTVVLHLSDNPGNVPPATQTLLQGGGTADSAFKWLYPYDATVFPRGLLAPTLQFAGTAPDAAYVQVSFSGLVYQGFYGSSSPGQIQFTPQLWTTITESASGTDAVKVQLTKISGGQVTGPITETWTIAQGSLKGTVYYSSYDSPLANGGAVLTIQPGATAPTVLMGGAGGCVVCHAVSADGSTITAAHQHSYDQSGDLTNGNATLDTITLSGNGGDHVFANNALYPDGSLALTCDNCVDVSSTNGNITPSQLMNPKTGAVIPAPGFDNVISRAGMPTFSSDGTKVAFNLYGVGPGYDPGSSLGIMDFAVGTHTFSNLATVGTDPTLFPTWPAFTPDGEWLLYQLGNTSYTRNSGTSGNLGVVHVPSGTNVLLDSLNGMANGTPYLPFSDDTNKDYEPTVLPVAVGGYFWVVFTSRREYGNTINDTDPWEGLFEGGIPAKRKKLWVAAIDIDNPAHPSTAAHDISHPAFYLDGQELAGGNSRGFWALSPCEQNGTSCQSGDQCCTGFCRQTNGADGGTEFSCVPPVTGCAQQYEKCTQSSDCCSCTGGEQTECIASHCACLVPQ